MEDEAKTPSARRYVVLLAGSVLALVLAAVTWTALVVTETGEWPFVRSPTPERLDFRDHTYTRGDDVGRVARGLVEVGATPHGGTIYAEPTRTTSVPVVVQVAAEDDVFWYGLADDE